MANSDGWDNDDDHSEGVGKSESMASLYHHAALSETGQFATRVAVNVEVAHKIRCEKLHVNKHKEFTYKLLASVQCTILKYMCSTHQYIHELECQKASVSHIHPCARYSFGP